MVKYRWPDVVLRLVSTARTGTLVVRNCSVAYPTSPPLVDRMFDGAPKLVPPGPEDAARQAIGVRVVAVPKLHQVTYTFPVGPTTGVVKPTNGSLPDRTGWVPPESIVHRNRWLQRAR